MYISHKSNVIQQFHETEWQCRRMTKGLNKSEYWAWVETVTTDGVSDFSGEDYEVIETQVDVQGFHQSGHITLNLEGTHYHLKWNASKKEVVKDDDAKTAWELSEEWTRIRAERDRLLADTDWMTCSDSPTMSAENKTYRQKLRDLPSDQKDETTYADITWPTKP